MQCDRAEEFFSDYLERTLDRPMTVAIESHLAGCVNCRDGVEALQSTFLALDSLPEVEPPADGAWRVMTAIRQQRAEQYEAQRQKAPTFLDWLRSLNPMSVAMGASLATLVIGGSLVATGLPGHVQLGAGSFAPRAPQPAPANARPAMPAIQVTYGAVSATGQALEIRVSPATDLPNGEVRVTGDAVPVAHVASGNLAAGVPVVFQVQAPFGSGVQVLRVVSHSASSGVRTEQTVVAPLGARVNEPLTLVATDQPLVDALRRVAPHLGRPVVVDGAPPVSVTLQAAEASAPKILEGLAERSQLTLREENNVYRMTPQ
jgi:hypothetical protein